MNKKTRTLLSIGAFVLFMAIAFVAYNGLTKSYTPPITAQKDPVPATELNLIDYEGENVKLSDFYGKPIIINLWATWCPYCIEEMPLFEEKYKEYGDDITFLMINITDGQQETVETAKAYIEENNFTFPVYFDTTLESLSGYNPRGSLPFTIFIDKSGNVSSYQPGKLSESKLNSGIDLLLK